MEGCPQGCPAPPRRAYWCERTRRTASRCDSNHPTAKADFAVQPRPCEIARIPTAGIACVDAVLVVADCNKPVSFAKRTGTIHEQRTLDEPGLQFTDRAKWPLSWSPRLQTLPAHCVAQRC